MLSNGNQMNSVIDHMALFHNVIVHSHDNAIGCIGYIVGLLYTRSDSDHAKCLVPVPG